MGLQIYPSPKELRNYIRHYWTWDSSGSIRPPETHIECFADRFPRLIFQNLNDFNPYKMSKGDILPECHIFGLNIVKSTQIIGSSFSLLGVSFYPHALKAIFDVDATDLVGESPDIRMLCKSEILSDLQMANSAIERINVLSKYFYNKIFYKKKQNIIIDSIIHSNFIKTNTKVYQLAKDLNISQKKLERIFKTAVGISPKKYQRIIRFEKSISLLTSPKYNDLTSISYDLDYTDQSHFIKDFKNFSDMNPYEFIKRYKIGSESSTFIYEE